MSTMPAEARGALATHNGLTTIPHCVHPDTFLRMGKHTASWAASYAQAHPGAAAAEAALNKLYTDTDTHIQEIAVLHALWRESFARKIIVDIRADVDILKTHMMSFRYFGGRPMRIPATIDAASYVVGGMSRGNDRPSGYRHYHHPIFCDLTIMFKPAVLPKEADRQAGVECAWL